MQNYFHFTEFNVFLPKIVGINTILEEEKSNTNCVI